MTYELEFDLDETPIFTSAGFSCGLLDLRAVVDAANEEQWWISDIGLRGYKPKESGGFDWSYHYLQLDDPLWLILHAAIMQTQLRQLKVAIHDKLQDIRDGITDAPFAPLPGIDSGDVRKHYEEA